MGTHLDDEENPLQEHVLWAAYLLTLQLFEVFPQPGLLS